MTDWNETMIARALSTQTFQRKCILLVPNCNWTGHEADVLGVTRDGRLIDVEIKISRADFKADAAKDKWWHRHYGEWNYSSGRQEFTSTRLDWPPKVWKHYYAIPREIWKPELAEAVSPKSGILLVSRPKGHGVVSVWSERRCTPNKDAGKISPAQALDIARLANIRMWAAFDDLARARREFADRRQLAEVAA